MGLFKLFFKILNFIESLISPAFCSNCRSFLSKRNVFCNICSDKIKLIAPYSLKINNSFSVPVFAISDYKEPLSSLIRSKHYSNYLASKDLGKLIFLYTNIKDLDFDYLVPIPLHWSRYYYRGYNQAEVMAKQVGKLTKKPLANLLKRKKYTKLQASLAKNQRELNLDSAFSLDKNFDKYKNKKLVLVDDLMTTGATIKTACLALKKIKPKCIYVYVACRVI